MQNSTQAKSFVGSIRESAHNFYATAMRGEVSDANVRGYLRAASQIEDIWQQIDDKIAAAIAAGTAPWDAYGQLRYPLVFIRAARACQVFVEQLLAADAAFDPKTVGYLPRVTYDQADALCHQIEPGIERAVAALNDPSFVPDIPLPLIIGPRVESEGTPCPVPHLEGMIAATREIREWAAGLLAQYSNAVSQAKVEVPSAITRHITDLQGQLAQGDSQLRYGSDLVGQVTQYGATPQLHEDAENSLWEAIQKFFLVNQAVAMPELLRGTMPAPRTAQGARRTSYRDMRIRPEDLWRVAAPSARSEIRGTEFGTDEMNEMCEKMGGILSAGAQQYLDETEAAVARGDTYIIAAMANCPFEPLYKARRPLEIAGANIPVGYEFHWNFHRGHIETAPRFGRVDNWQECEE